MRGEGFRALEQFPIMDRWDLVEQRQRFVANNALHYFPRLVQTGGTTVSVGRITSFRS